MLTVIEHATFVKESKKILTNEQYIELIDFISVNYGKGDTISGTGGVKKVRFAHQTGKGKSGGSRIIYLVVDKNGCVHLLDIFEKNAKENLSAADKVSIKKLAEILKKEGKSNV